MNNGTHHEIKAGDTVGVKDAVTLVKTSEDKNVAGNDDNSVDISDNLSLLRESVFDALKKESQELRRDFITTFGLFAALLTFTVIQVEAFIKATRMAQIVGLASFSLASFLTLVLCLQYMFKKDEETKSTQQTVVVGAIILAFLFFAFESFWYSTHVGRHGGKLWP